MTIDPTEFNYISELIYRRSGIVLGIDKDYLVEARLSTLAKQTNHSSIQALIAEIKRKPETDNLHTLLVEAMTTNETSFFRDANPFQLLQSEILPKLYAKTGNNTKLTIWCAASSTGQEPYSIAMLICEHFPHFASHTRIIASDIASNVIRKAKEGLYSQIEVNRGLPATLLSKYFHREGINWRINSEIRAMVDFIQMNLLEPWNKIFSADIVFLRNVLIYFDVVTKKLILQRARKIMPSGGVLILGGAETTSNIDDGFERVQIAQTGYFRKIKD